MPAFHRTLNRTTGLSLAKSVFRPPRKSGTEAVAAALRIGSLPAGNSSSKPINPKPCNRPIVDECSLSRLSSHARGQHVPPSSSAQSGVPGRVARSSKASPAPPGPPGACWDSLAQSRKPQRTRPATRLSGLRLRQAKLSPPRTPQLRQKPLNSPLGALQEAVGVGRLLL